MYMVKFIIYLAHLTYTNPPSQYTPLNGILLYKVDHKYRRIFSYYIYLCSNKFQ